ncbi:uncharacterized protein LOC144542287 [Centroberyx gerrardi]
MDFLLKSTETQDFLNRLRVLQMTYPDFHRKCQAYIELLNTLRKPVAKALSKATCQKKYHRFIHGQATLHDCQRVLREAKKDMLGIYGKLLQHQRVEEEEKTLFRYNCEAILMLKHFQRPGAVEGLTVSEWLDQKRVDGRVCVGVSQHKTATMQIATFALTEEEAAMLDEYYNGIRQGCMQDGVDDEGRFFLSKSGGPISSATNDLRRLHEHYKIPNITSQEVRKVAETANEKYLIYVRTPLAEMEHF